MLLQVLHECLADKALDGIVVLFESPEAPFHQGEVKAAIKPREKRRLFKQRFQPVRIGIALTGHHPVGRALVNVQMRDLVDDFRDDLYGAGRRADHRNALTRKIDVIAPLRSMEDRPLELVPARNIGDVRLMQAAEAADDEIRYRRFPACKIDAPLLAVMADGGHAPAELDEGIEAVFVRATLHVVPDLAAGGEPSRPIRVGLKGKRIKMRGHVAGNARIAVLAPGAADLAGFLVDAEVFKAFLFQPDRHAHAGEPCAENGDAGASRPTAANGRSDVEIALVIVRHGASLARDDGERPALH